MTAAITLVASTIGTTLVVGSSTVICVGFTAVRVWNKYNDLHTSLKNIYLQIRREQKLITISQKKIKLAESVLKDEAENYSFGKVTLNDYIDAVNLVDANRFQVSIQRPGCRDSVEHPVVLPPSCGLLLAVVGGDAGSLARPSALS